MSLVVQLTLGCTVRQQWQCGFFFVVFVFIKLHYLTFIGVHVGRSIRSDAFLQLTRRSFASVQFLHIG